MTLHYVYGITDAGTAGAIDSAHLEGIDGTSVHAVVEGPFAAAVSAVSDSEYATDAFNEHLRDLEWLTPRAAAHQSVNVRLLDLTGSVLPLSFGTLYRDETRVREMLRDDVAGRHARLDAVSGRAEWVVTVTREGETAAAQDELRALDDEIARATPGKAFLLERRRTSVATAASERADVDAARRALDALAAVSERTYREPVARGGADAVALRVSLLAPHARADAVDAAIADLERELGGAGYRVRSTGPWPAYRFGSLS